VKARYPRHPRGRPHVSLSPWRSPLSILQPRRIDNCIVPWQLRSLSLGLRWQHRSSRPAFNPTPDKLSPSAVLVRFGEKFPCGPQTSEYQYMQTPSYRSYCSWGPRNDRYLNASPPICRHCVRGSICVKARSWSDPSLPNNLSYILFPPARTRDGIP